MGALGNAILGLIFWILGLANTLLMFKLWGYPFDHERMVSTAPRPLMWLHRAIGYAFLVIYLYLMSQMVPRMWQYQVELPARTVAHLSMGISIGIILALKILIVRFFRHLESTMVPSLGTLLLICTTVLIGLSVPMSLREAYMSRRLATGTAGGDQAIERVKTLLPKAGLPKGIPIQNASNATICEPCWPSPGHPRTGSRRSGEWANAPCSTRFPRKSSGTSRPTWWQFPRIFKRPSDSSVSNSSRRFQPMSSRSPSSG
jgi:hypothetical protein